MFIRNMGLSLNFAVFQPRIPHSLACILYLCLVLQILILTVQLGLVEYFLINRNPI
jgi:hypothetical protein